MESDYEAQRSRILDLIDHERYEEALSAFEGLSVNWKKKGRLIIARGDCFYELGKDVEALECYLWYVKVFPQGFARNFALFGAAVCLKNLDLQEEALKLLERIDEGHEGKQRELAHSRDILARQKGARKLVDDYLAQAPDEI